MKKITSFILVLCLLLSFAPTAYAASANAYEESLVLVQNADGIYEIGNMNSRAGVRVTAKDGGQIYEGAVNGLFMRIDATHFMEAEVLSVDAYNYSQFKVIANNKGVSAQLQSDIDKIMAKVRNGEIELTEPLAVYVPKTINVENGSRGITTKKTTYSGYAGREYYQELLDCKGNSLEFNVKMPSSKWSQYCSQVFQSIVTTSASAGLDAVSYGTWTLLSVFLHSTSDSISTTKAIKHTAKLFENKYIKYTYVIQNGEYYLGSVIEYSYNYFFENFINVDGEAFYSDGKTPQLYAKGAGYDKADEYAYRNYTNASYNNSITRYDYKNNSAGIHTYVNSLF